MRTIINVNGETVESCAIKFRAPDLRLKVGDSRFIIAIMNPNGSLSWHLIGLARYLSHLLHKHISTYDIHIVLPKRLRAQVYPIDDSIEYRLSYSTH